MPRHFHSAPGRENATRHQEYATLTVTLITRTAAAIKVKTEDLVQAVWLPKVCLDIHGKLEAENSPLDSEIEIGIEVRMAEQKGLL